MAAARKQVQGSLWGRLTGREPASAQRPASPVATMPRHRALTARDALYTVNAQTGRRQYVPLTVDGVRMAGRCWCHCGDLDGVLLVAWHERDDLRAVMRWRVLADNAVMLTESAA